MEINEAQLKRLIERGIDNRESSNAFNPSIIPYHTHNGTDSPLIPFDGLLAVSFILQNSLLSNQVVSLVDVSSAAITLTLPNAIGNDGRQFIIKDWKGASSTNAITIQPIAGQTIDGAATKVINANYSAFYVISDGANWSIL